VIWSFLAIWKLLDILGWSGLANFGGAHHIASIIIQNEPGVEDF